MRDELLDPAPSAHRRLTTVLSADVKGYSRLMEADEEGTHATLKDYRDAMSRLIAAHGGRVVNTWGDGLIAEFPSVVEAVRAAIDVQNELAGRNAGRATEKRMLFRIGINLGDVIVDGGDIYGDGVNIAARLQAEAPPGGILISSTVYEQVRNKVAVGFDFLGELEVKNVGEKVPSYAIRIGEDAGSPPPIAERAGSLPRSREPAGGQDHRDRGRPAGPQLAPGRGALILAVVGLGLAGINLLTPTDVFWAKWPLLAFAGVAAANWARTLPSPWRRPAFAGVVGAFIVGVNAFTWSGEFWAKWPLMGLAIAVGIGWAWRSGGAPQRR